MNDLVAKGIADELKTATDFGDLEVDQPITIDGDRGRPAEDLGQRPRRRQTLDIVATVDRTVTKQDLRVSSATPKVELSVSDGVTVSLKSRFALSVVWTGPPTTRSTWFGRAARRDSTWTRTRASTTPPRRPRSASSASPSPARRSMSTPTSRARSATRTTTASCSSAPPANSVSRARWTVCSASAWTPTVRSRSTTPTRTPAAPCTRASSSAPRPRASRRSRCPATISTTIKVDWNDIGTGAPVVDAPDLAATVGRFQNMTLQDLAEGLAQLVATLTAIQKAKFDPDKEGPLPAVGDLDLPFLKGTLSDAIQTNAGAQGLPGGEHRSVARPEGLHRGSDRSGASRSAHVHLAPGPLAQARHRDRHRPERLGLERRNQQARHDAEHVGVEAAARRWTRSVFVPLATKRPTTPRR